MCSIVYSWPLNGHCRDCAHSFDIEDGLGSMLCTIQCKLNDGVYCPEKQKENDIQEIPVGAN